MIAQEVVLDLHRTTRIGLGEAIYCAGKSPEQIEHILEVSAPTSQSLLLTRLDCDKFLQLPEHWQSRLDYCAVSGTAVLGTMPAAAGSPLVALVAAGTSDIPVLREAERTLRQHGEIAAVFADVGVAGLWRLTSRLEQLRAYPVMIVVAGMDAALPTVLGGLVAASIVAVPTSVGYGVATGGQTALNAMLSSCAPGIAVVNIDNGYGAACAAMRIIRGLRATDAAAAFSTPPQAVSA